MTFVADGGRAASLQTPEERLKNRLMAAKGTDERELVAGVIAS